MESFCRRLKTLFYEEKTGLGMEFCLFSPMVPFDRRREGRYRPVGSGEGWGENWDRAWFHLKGRIPAGWKGRDVCAHIDLGGEGLIFDGAGVPLQGLSVHTIWPHPDFDRKRFSLFDPAKGNEEVDLWVEAVAAELFGLDLQPDDADSPPETYGRHRAVIGECFLALFRRDIRRLYLEVSLLFDLMKSLPENSIRRKRILRALGAAADVFSRDAKDVQKSADCLRPELEKRNAPSDLRTTAVGHAHIDTAWLWPLEETVRKCGRTFANQLDLINRFPGYVFGASQAQHYAFVKDAYPLLYSRIKDKIREGRWEVQGGMWVEADCNLIGGESMVRQILHGKNFFQEEFGVDVRFLWLPDVFGYSAAMPQILLKSGMETMVTQKISWNQFNRFPHHSFCWRGLDGSEVVVHFPPEDNYNSLLRPSELRRAQNNFAEGDFLDEFLTLFGVGDGGGGPTEESLETGRLQQDLEGVPAVRYGKAGEFLDRLLERKSELPLWAGELYLEMHRGTYTTQAANKKMNRVMELSLRAAEMLWSALPPHEYPSTRLDALWKTVLLNQFHDIIPGSSITPVYEESRDQYRKAAAEVKELTAKAGDKLFKRNDGCLCLVNTLSCDFTGAVVLPDSWQDGDVWDEKGRPVPLQEEGRRRVIRAQIQALGSLTVRKGPAGIEMVGPDAAAGHQRESGASEGGKSGVVASSGSPVLENKLIRYTFDGNGSLISAYDKTTKREVLRDGGKGNVLCLYEDRPVNWDAWDVDVYYAEQLREKTRAKSVHVCTDGPVRLGLEVRSTVGRSSLVQRIFLAEGSRRLDFETAVEWREDHKLLRVLFDVAVESDRAGFEIQFGHVRRATHTNTSWERAQFEVVGHRFADLSDLDYGAALLNDGKYGYSVKDGIIGLSLLRAPTQPDPTADRGAHTFIYSFLPHPGALQESDVLYEAARLNQPPLLFDGYDGRGFSFPWRIEGGPVVLETIKKAERGNGTVLRFYEPFGKRASIRLHLEGERKNIRETDLMEGTIRDVEIRDGAIDLDFLSFEIKTLMVDEAAED